MSSVAFQLVLIGLVAWAAWQLFRPRYAFHIRVRQGAVHLESGKVRPAVLRDLTDVIQSAGLQQASIKGKSSGKRVVLEFSSEIPAATQQQIRNTWYSQS